MACKAVSYKCPEQRRQSGNCGLLTLPEPVPPSPWLGMTCLASDPLSALCFTCHESLPSNSPQPRCPSPSPPTPFLLPISRSTSFIPGSDLCARDTALNKVCVVSALKKLAYFKVGKTQ